MTAAGRVGFHGQILLAGLVTVRTLGELGSSAMLPFVVI